MSLILAMVAALLAAQENAEPTAVVQVRLAPARVQIGDPVTLELSACAPGAVDFRASRYSDEPNRLLVQQLGTSKETDILGNPRLICRFRLVPFEVGELKLVPPEIEAVYADGRSEALAVPEVTLNVLSVAQGQEGPDSAAALKPPLYPPQSEQGQSPWLWLVVAVLVIAGAAVAALLIRGRTPAKVRQLLRTSAARRALDELARLEALAPPAPEMVVPFYSRLADAVRRYIGLRYHFKALEKTSEELRAAAEQLWPQGSDLTSALGGVLVVSDLVKFARHMPAEHQAEERIALGRRIVEATRDDVEDEPSNEQEREDQPWS